jgi:hypothetical protein
MTQLDCPPFLSDSLLNTEGYFGQDSTSTGWFNKASELQPEDIKDGINADERTILEKENQKQQKKEERREKLRKLWGEKLFGNKDNE